MFFRQQGSVLFSLSTWGTLNGSRPTFMFVMFLRKFPALINHNYMDVKLWVNTVRELSAMKDPRVCNEVFDSLNVKQNKIFSCKMEVLVGSTLEGGEAAVLEILSSSICSSFNDSMPRSCQAGHR